MFTKDVPVGAGSYKITKKVIDWEAVGAAIVWVVIGLAIVSYVS